jgi:hypothetical protein
MARKTFFSFHYERDAWTAGQVRNCNLIPSEDEFGFIDSVDWEEIKRKGIPAIEKWINDQLKSTSVTVVLIGAETASREWVNFEIRQSWARGNGLVGVRIHNMKDMNKETDVIGANPFDAIMLADGVPLSNICKTYDWVVDDGRNNMGSWIEEAFQRRESCQGETALKSARVLATVGSASPTPRQSAPSVIRNPSQPWAM